jgi:hypothetical protein
MSKIQTWTIVFLFAVLTFAACWHFYRMDQYRQEQLSIERVRLGQDLLGSGKLSDLGKAHMYIKRDNKYLATRNKPPSPAP